VPVVTKLARSGPTFERLRGPMLPMDSLRLGRLKIEPLVIGLIQFKALDIFLFNFPTILALDPFPGGAIVRTKFDHFLHLIVHGDALPVLFRACRCDRYAESKQVYASRTGAGDALQFLDSPRILG
jgi:hypothetical protein